MTTGYFGHPDSQLYRRRKPLLEVLCAATWPVPRTVIESIFEDTADLNAILDGLSTFVHFDTETNNLQQRIDGWLEWLSDVHRAGEEFWVDVKSGHNRFAALFLKFCANKSISIEHAEQDYLVCISNLFLVILYVVIIHCVNRESMGQLISTCAQEVFDPTPMRFARLMRRQG